MHIYTNLLFSNLKILACGHKYHVECLEEIGQKCLPCLENGIQANVNQLLEYLTEMQEEKDKKKEKKQKKKNIEDIQENITEEAQKNITKEFINKANKDDNN
ncbi:18786_t:CDS:1, partial [Gigaspora margarita]